MSYLSNNVNTNNNNLVPCLVHNENILGMCMDSSNNIYMTNGYQITLLLAHSANPNVLYGISGAIMADTSYGLHNGPGGPTSNVKVICNNGYAINRTGRGGLACE